MTQQKLSYKGDCLSPNSFIKQRGVDLLNEPIIVKLIDPSYNYDLLSLADFDYTKPLPVPDTTHMLAIHRAFSENEKEDMWRGLQILEYTNQLEKYTQLETYKQKAIDLDIYMFEFEYVKGRVRAKC